MPNDMPMAASPPGAFMENSYGHLVPTSLVKAELRLQDQLVRDLVARAERLREHVAAEKAAMRADVHAFLDLLDQQYGVKRVGERGGVKLDSFDGLLRVTVSTSDSIALGPQLSAARELINGCITRWAEGANANLQAIVDDAFRVGDSGKLAVDRVLGLRRLNIDDPEWKRAMEAIGDAVQVVRSREYLRLYRRASRDNLMGQISVDWSRL